MPLLTDAQWQRYNDVINDAHNSFNQQEIIWLKSLGGIDPNGEDNLTERFTAITLLGLFEYNVFHKWPIEQDTETGGLPRQSEVLYLNKKYLEDLGYLDAAGNMNYDMDADRFIHRGIKYKSKGDPDVSQDKSKPLLFMIILQKEEIQTGDTQGQLPVPDGSGVGWPIPPNVNPTFQEIAILSGDIDGTNASFTLEHIPLQVTWQGQLLTLDAVTNGYTLSGLVITLTEVPSIGDTVRAFGNY